jgi:hypothetical protein
VMWLALRFELRQHRWQPGCNFTIRPGPGLDAPEPRARTKNSGLKAGTLSPILYSAIYATLEGCSLDVLVPHSNTYLTFDLTGNVQY